MRIITLTILLTMLLACGSEDDPQLQEHAYLPETESLPDNQTTATEKLPNSYIVALKPENFDQPKSLYFSSFAQEFSHNSRQFFSLLDAPGIKHWQHIGTVDLKASAPLDHKPEVNHPLELELAKTLQKKPESAVLMRVDFSSETAAKDHLRKWELLDKIWYAEPNEISHLSGDFTTYGDNYAAIADGGSDVKKNHNLIKLVPAFYAIDAVNTNPSRPIIAILDSGVDRLHPSLVGRTWENIDGNIGAAGCKNDRYGCNTTTSFKDSLGDGAVFPTKLNDFGTPCESPNGKLDPECSHGTHVAAIAAGDVGTGVPGICPVCTVLPIRIVGKIPDTDKYGILDSSILAGLKYISRFKTSGGDAGIQVVNASFGKFTRSKSVAVFVDLIHDQVGAIITGAAGNEDTNRMSYPASLSKVIAVSAIGTKTLTKTIFSNYGSWVDIAAPGDLIYSAIPGTSQNAFTKKDGTSMAAPFVAGLAGLIIAKECTLNQPCGLSPLSIRKWILDAADPSIYNNLNTNYNPKIVGNPTKIPLLGRGVMDAEAAIKEIKNPNQTLVSEDYDRVPDFCATIHYQRGQGNLAWIFLLLPMILVVFNLKLSK